MEISKKQQTILDFANQGEIVDGILEMPTLWSLDSHNKYRYWNLNIGITNSKTGEKLDVTEEYINQKKLPKGYIGIYWTESGPENTKKPIVSAETQVTKGKGVGTKSETTPFTQAISDARTDFNRKIRKGHTLEKEQLNAREAIVSIPELLTQTHRGNKPWRVFMMALHDVNKNNNWSHVKFPCYLQTKLDGTAYIIVYHPDLPEITIRSGDKKIKVKMDGYSRGREDYGKQEHILAELYPTLKKYPGLHIVGELWKKGYGLQDISGSSRRQLDSKIKEDSIKLDLNIFDCFYIDQPNLTFEERIGIIDDVVYSIPEFSQDEKGKKEENHVKKMPTYEIENKDDLLAKYRTFLNEKLEGAVIRNTDSLHEFGIDKEKRSYNTLKLKPRPDAEWPVIDFKEGSGKEKGAVIWICCENDDGITQRLNDPKAVETPLIDRKTFSVTPNMKYEDRYRIFEKFTEDPDFFKKNIFSQLVTIDYSILSKDFLPQQPKVLRFRDPKVQALLNEL